MRKANFTIEYDSDEQLYHFELFLKQQIKVTDFRIIPDSKDLYNTDPIYKKMWKQLKKDKNAMYDYIKKNT
tara:strand:+ start:716 stop:928 length:213 start_codon:yes stop_codon:yes gene_type:complete